MHTLYSAYRLATVASDNSSTGTRNNRFRLESAASSLHPTVSTGPLLLIYEFEDLHKKQFVLVFTDVSN